MLSTLAFVHPPFPLKLWFTCDMTVMMIHWTFFGRFGLALRVPWSINLMVLCSVSGLHLQPAHLQVLLWFGISAPFLDRDYQICEGRRLSAAQDGWIHS